MKLIKLTFTLSLALLLGSKGVEAQLFIAEGTDFMIEDDAVVGVQGFVESEVDILSGPVKHNGLLLMNGPALQDLNMNGFIIPNLEVDNVAHVNLTGNAKIAETAVWTNGKIIANTSNLRIDHDAVMSGYGPGKFFETNLTGELQKDILVANLASYEMPVGVGAAYNPLKLTSTGPYQAGAFVGVRDTLDTHPKLFAQATDYLLNYWPITQTGITGTLTGRAVYNEVNPVDQVNGTDLKFAGFFWQDQLQEWSVEGSFVDQGANITGNLIKGNGDLYAMNNYGLVNARVFLQGAYDEVNHLMRDQLRMPLPNVIPATDPYRVAPLNTAFTHVNNPNTETILDPAAVFADQAQANNNIVDWVYLEVRKPANNILATRAALVQRDGDVVDVDGVSPVYVKDIPAGNDYTVAVRHRNHLGIASDVATKPITINITAPPLVDFTTMTDAQIFGPATAYKIAADNKNVLWGGNANFNVIMNVNGLNNDKDELMAKTLNNNPGAFIFPAYHASDVNMNKIVNANGLNNDKDFMFVNVLNNNPAAFRLQSLPQ